MKEYINHIVQKIANKEFGSKLERTVITHNDRVQFRCPFCHEGRTKAKKRGNIYYNKLLFICFRCGHKTSFDKFCKDFNEQIDPEKKLEMIEHLNEVMTYSDFEGDFVDARFDDLIDMEEIERVFNSDITPISDFQPIKKNGGIYKYLVGRGITEQLHKNIYQAKYWINDDQYEWVIVMLNRRESKILGMQIRNLKSGKKRMFKIYNYENLLEWVNCGKENPKELDVNQLVIYNKLSYYFNILNVNLIDTVTVFEGYLDSLFYPNSIGLIGVNTDSKFLENNDIDIQYIFDNDEAGFKKSEEKIKKGYHVFLWNKLFEDIVSKKETDDPYRLLHRISKVKDLNKLCEIVPDAYEKLNLLSFFSQDILDLKWIPRIKKKIIKEKDYNYKFNYFNKL
jgi:hypothetical protein